MSGNQIALEVRRTSKLFDSGQQSTIFPPYNLIGHIWNVWPKPRILEAKQGWTDEALKPLLSQLASLDNSESDSIFRWLLKGSLGRGICVEIEDFTWI